jgi:hypothetical protein
MKYLRLFESFQSDEDTNEGIVSFFRKKARKREVAKICDKYGIRNWSINSLDGLVDVDGDVNCISEGFSKFPLNFGKVTGNFDCGHNGLTSLEGGPHTVDGNFICSANKLTSLDGSPKEVGGNFFCYLNNLTSFEGCTQKIGGGLYCSHNKLTSFEGCPKSLISFDCISNPLYNIWRLINPEAGNYANEWDYQFIELLNDYDCIRGKDLIIDRFNDFLEEIGKSPVEKVEGYNNI